MYDIVMCSECGKATNVKDLKYHTADMKKLFCGAECSVNWHNKNNNEERRTDRVN